MRYRLIAGRNPGAFTGPGTNTYLLPGATPTLIDTAEGAAAFLDEVAEGVAEPGSEGDRSRTGLHQVLVTHAHPDHIGGARAVAERFPGAGFAKFPWPDVDAGTELSWRPLADDTVLTAGDGHLWVLHTPGHAPDHVCFYDPRSAVIFAGDLVLNGGSVVIPASRGGHLSSYLRSLHRVLDLKPRRMLPGHGDPVENPAALIRAYLAHRQQREQQVVGVLKAGPATPDEIVGAIYQGTPEAVRAAARESVLAHLVRLEEMGHARQEAGCWVLS